MASVASADPATDGLLSLLRQQGFSEIRVSRTFLGRVRIVATDEKTEREIVLNPRTGEILRDFWTSEDDSGHRRSALIELGSSHKSGEDESGDDGQESSGSGDDGSSGSGDDSSGSDSGSDGGSDGGDSGSDGGSDGGDSGGDDGGDDGGEDD